MIDYWHSLDKYKLRLYLTLVSSLCGSISAGAALDEMGYAVAELADDSDDIVIRFITKADYEHLQQTGQLPVYQGQTFATTPKYLGTLDDLTPAGIAQNVHRASPSYGSARAQHYVAFNREAMSSYTLASETSNGWEILWRDLPVHGWQQVGPIEISVGYIDLSQFVLGKTSDDLQMILQILGVK